MQRLVVVCPLLLVAAPAAAQDRVEFIDRAKGQTTARLGKIETENPVHVVLVSGLAKTKTVVPTADVVDTRYEDEPPETTQGRLLEAKKQFEAARAKYREALAQAPKTNRLLLAYLEWKIAKLGAYAAEGEGGTNFARADVVNALRAHLKAYPDSRYAVDALELMGRLLLRDDEPTAEVASGLRDVKKKYAGLSKELALRCDLLESQLLLQEGQNLYGTKTEEARARYKEAAAKLTELAKVVDKNTAYNVRVALAECQAALGQLPAAVKELDAILKAAPDDHVRTLAHLTRADCYRMNGQHRDAMWDYLWVDVIYNQDREATARALYHLIGVFIALGDKDKADQTRDRLKKEYGDTRYGRRG